MPPVLLSDLDAGVMTLTLNRPDQHNALNSALITAIREGIRSAAADPAVRVVVMTGAGGSFCAGADLLEVEGVASEPARFRVWLHAWSETFRSLELCGKPVIACVNGAAMAGGLELALASDIIVASSRARFCDAHIRHGLVPGGGGTQRIPAAVGTRWARWLMYTGEVIDAAQAERIGLVQKVIAEEDFAQAVHEIAVTMARRSSVALSFMKRMTATRLVSQDMLDMEIEAAAHIVAGADAREGLVAFKERREPVFGMDGRDWKS
jgi:enoyl-CoA hydratase/carnithine racemase